MRTGIYLIKNKLNNKVYVGSTISYFNRRWNQHKSDLRLNKHKNKHLQAAWNKHGELVFEFIIHELTTIETILIREQYWLDHFKSYNPNNGYNITVLAQSRLGTKGKSLLHKGRGKWSKESKTKLSDTNTGRIRFNIRRPIIQLSMNGEFVKEWDSCTSAANSLRIQCANINAVLNQRGRITAGGYKWTYKT